LGAYSYGNSAHVHAATAIGSAYTAAYDLAGDMTCRAPTSATTCSGTQNGAELTYNTDGQLSNWQNQPSNPTTTASFLYDAQGNRVAQQTTSGGTTTTTVYVGNLEEDATTGSTTTKTTYYYANGMRFAMAVNGVFSYLALDGLGSANVSLDANGNVTASLLYAPYGSARYSSGTMPTDHGFTGQIADAMSGLAYYGARYYDPVATQFNTADTILPDDGFNIWGLSRYAYVEGNPIVRSDPTGRIEKCACEDDFTNRGNPVADNPLGGVGTWVQDRVSDFKNTVRQHADTIRLFSALASIGSGAASIASLICQICAPFTEQISAWLALGAMGADAALAFAGIGEWGEVWLDALGFVPGVGIWRADAKITRLGEEYEKLDGRTRAARALKGLIAGWKGAKEAAQNLDFLGAVKDISQGLKSVISQYLPVGDNNSYPSLVPPQVRQRES
jgi:RHS repeat-associated protein